MSMHGRSRPTTQVSCMAVVVRTSYPYNAGTDGGVQPLEYVPTPLPSNPLSSAVYIHLNLTLTPSVLNLTTGVQTSKGVLKA